MVDNLAVQVTKGTIDLNELTGHLATTGILVKLAEEQIASTHDDQA
jgi:hypothetical protein